MKGALLLAFLASVPCQAQVVGRWKLTLEDGSRSTVRGELVLHERDGQPEGVLLLENRDSAWMVISDQRFGEDGTVAFSAGSRDLRFEGQMVNDELEGTASDRGAHRYRWRGIRLQPEDEYYAAQPRFRQRQIQIGGSRRGYRIPGRWLAAAAAGGDDAGSVRLLYVERAIAAGLTALPADSLSRYGLVRAMGLFRRQEMVSAAVSTLERIRSGLRSDTGVARFDHIFRPQGVWLVDVHDVALARARRPFPTLSWESARTALAAASLLDRDTAEVEAIPLALYRLFALSRSDTSEYRAAEQAMREADHGSAAAVSSLLQGYEQATLWYVEAMRFLLQQQWLPGRSLPRSPVDLVRSIWGDSATIPDIQCRVFGYPEGAVRIGTDDRIVRAVLVPANAPAVDWLNRHGTPALVEVLHRLPVPFPAPTRLNAGGELFRLSSVEQYARESFSGFLEPRDVILLDPSYQPLLALGTLIHEWQHILHERARQREPAAGTFRPQGDQLRVTQLDPFLAEGLAEWLTEEMLAPVNLQFPLLLFGEAEKRASLSNDDPHQLGYIMVQSLARALGDPRATLDLLVRSGNDPALILADRRVSRAWSRYSAPDRLLQRRGDRVLLPQVVFTIEDNHPDLVESDILTPTD